MPRPNSKYVVSNMILDLRTLNRQQNLYIPTHKNGKFCLVFEAAVCIVFKFVYFDTG